MGLSSSTENTEQKAIDATGNVNNNIIIQEAQDTHSQLITNEKLLVATYFLCAIEAIKMGVYVFLKYRKNLKNKYENNSAPARNP